MKKLAFTLILFAGTANAQNNQMSFYSLYEAPVKSVMPNMNDNFGLGFTYGYKPFDRVPGYLELDVSTSKNSYLTTGSTTPSGQPHYTTNMEKYLIGTKFVTGNDYSLFRFYATPQAGALMFRSTATYYQPIYDNGDVKDIDGWSTKHDRFQHSFSGVYGGQIGAEISLNRMFNLHTTHDNRLIITGSFLKGNNNMSYINLDNVRNVNVNSDNQNVINLPNNSFLNKTASTEVNHTNFMMWGVRVGYVFNF